MSEVNFDVTVVEVEFEVTASPIELSLVPLEVTIEITPPDLYSLEVTAPINEIVVSPVEIDLTFNPPPIVNFSVGGGVVGGGGGEPGEGECWVPVGGSTGQVLAKRTNADFDLTWSPGGINTYRTPWETLPDVPRLGDIWFDGDHNNVEYRWDGVAWVDVHDQNIDLAITLAEDNQGAILDQSDEIEQLHQELAALSITTDEVEKAANTADGRVSMSDYIPTPDDLTYPTIKYNATTGEDEVVYVPRIEGSIWFQRTRPRKNLLTNPSLEVNANGWQATGATILREAHGANADLAGSYCLRVTNTAANAWVDPTYTFPTAESQWYAASAYVELISGSGVGCFITLAFYDAGNTLLLSAMGEAEDLVLGPLSDPANWNRLNAVVQAPAGSSYVRAQFHNPNAGDVWYLGASIVENLDELGKYFDGDSYDGFWEGTRQASTSRLNGNKIIGVWELHNETWVQKVFTDTTLDYIDASKIINLDKFFPVANSITTNMLDVPLITASEILGAGDIVNTYNLGGQFRVRKASAAAGSNFPASGFVLNDVTVGASVRVYHLGVNIPKLSMNPGQQWLSETPGRVTDLPPTAVGCTVQQVGYAADLFRLSFAPLLPIRIV